MITEIPINEAHIFAFEVSGKLVEADYAEFRPKLDQLLKKERPLSLLIKLKDFDGWTAKAAWEDLKIGFNHDDDFLRIAIVGKSLWEQVMAELGNLFLATKVRYFDDTSIALSWLNEVKNKAERDEYKGYRHILVANDFSSFSQDALKKATELGAPFQSKITVLHAAELLSVDIYPSLGELAVPLITENPEFEKKNLARINNQLDQQLKTIDYSKELISTEIISGHPVDHIIEFAKQNNVDLIVMGSHGKRGLSRLLGSATNGVINHAPCDVLTVV